ncbi:hypothetical protein RclHR1_17080001 [Rhizophagus clarus]|uniref:HMG box domain-containing protein n=1 Tax=Rhizophagus clarus TaxID=94130 RepID=A0A2Z6QN94_9GLOM|nr:hypothetical protein RclHR1_17080001 [Rhizophagus clarus]GES81477.1 hypothetical protein GLOIN_2v1476184 [Rhizophagus clarus]
MRSPNKYIIFCKFYKKILDEEYPQLSPQEKAGRAGKFWHYIPNELKNSFEIYAHHEKLIRNNHPSNAQVTIIPDSMNLPIIYDQRVRFTNVNQNLTQQDNGPSRNDEDVVFNAMYSMYIDDNATL